MEIQLSLFQVTLMPPILWPAYYGLKKLDFIDNKGVILLKLLFPKKLQIYIHQLISIMLQMLSYYS